MKEKGLRLKVGEVGDFVPSWGAGRLHEKRERKKRDISTINRIFCGVHQRKRQNLWRRQCQEDVRSGKGGREQRERGHLTLSERRRIWRP